MADEPQKSIVDWIWHGLLGVFSVAFLGWAGAVWHATDVVSQLAVEFRAMNARLDVMERELDAHRNLEGHSESMKRHERADAQIENLQQQLDRRIGAQQSQIDRLLDDHRRVLR